MTELRPGDMLLFRGGQGLTQAIQMAADGATHVEVIAYPGDMVTVFTLGSDKPEGLLFRDRVVGTDHAVVRVCAASPIPDNIKQEMMQKFFDWRTANYRTGYGDKNLYSGIVNEAIDVLTKGGWTKRPAENYGTELDCSVTVGLIIRMLFPGFEFQRIGQSDLIDPRTLTPGDLLNCIHTQIIKPFGV